MFRDDEFAPVYMPSLEHPAIPTISSDEIAISDSVTYLDDVFGSCPASPVEAESADVDTSHVRGRAGEDPSDIPRMRSQHSTAGYRDGIAAAKAKFVQAGFDEGFSLGAVLGLRVGEILGTLEGIANAVTSRSPGGMAKDQVVHPSTTATSSLKPSEDDESVWRTAESARKELSLERVFGPEYWGTDGIWKFSVRDEETDSQVTFSDVADAHPLIARWQIITDQAVCNVGLQLRSLEDTDRDTG